MKKGKLSNKLLKEVENLDNKNNNHEKEKIKKVAKAKTKRGK